MLPNLNSNLDFHSKALVIRAERQRVIASNIANVDTPGYSAHNLDFKEAMNTANGASNNTLALTQSKACQIQDTGCLTDWATINSTRGAKP